MSFHFSAQANKIKNLFLPLSMITLLSVSCSSEKTTKKVGAGKLLIESGSETPNDNDAYFEPGQKLSPIQAFQLTSHSFLQKRCGGGGDSCHATENSPLFASDDIEVAFREVYEGQRIDPLNIDRSRLILRLDPENHYCWVPDCSEAAAEMRLKIKDWVSEITDGSIEKLQADAVRFSSTESFTLGDLSPIINPNIPEDISTVLTEAESGVLAGATAVDDPLLIASGGKYVKIEGTNSVEITFTIAEAGDYFIFGLSSGLDEASNSTTISIDGGGNTNWDGAITSEGEFLWSQARENSINLTAGDHTLKVTGRDADVNFLFDGFAATTDAEFKGTEIRTKILKFDLAKIQEVDLQATGTLEIEIKVYDKNTYELKNLIVNLDSGSVNIRGVKILMNGAWNPLNSTYMYIGNTGEKAGEVVKDPGGSLSTSVMMMGIETLGEDSFSLQFEEIK